MKKIISLIITLVAFLPLNVFALTPTDPQVAQWSYVDTKVFEAWERATGSREVVVAIIDNGFDTFHPDLYPNVWKNEDEIADNGLDDDKNSYVDDVWGWDFSPHDFNGDGLISDEEKERGDNDPRPQVEGVRHIADTIHHGTAVAGIIGALGNNGEDGAGISWQVRLMNLKVINNDTVNEQGPLIKAIRYAVDNGADIINISLVGDTDQDIRAAVKYAYDRGVAVIAAAGNTRVALNLSPLDPVCADDDQSEDWVLGVSAININHTLASFSNAGAKCIDLTAPGVGISSTLRYAPRYGLDRRYGGNWQGTSFAAPFVSGAAALIKAIQPAWAPKQIYQALLSTVHRTPPTDVAAYENLYGAGLLQINQAVAYALSQLNSVHRLRRIVSVDLKSGNLLDRYAAADRIKTTGTATALTRVDDVAAHADGFVTYRQVRPGRGEVVIYDKDWQIKTHWTVPARGPQDLAVGDVLDDDALEIVLAPVYPDRQVLRIFNLAGKELKKLNISGPHAGVSLGLIDVAGKQEILAVYRDNGTTMLFHLAADLSVVRGLPLPFVKNTGPVSAGDLDGDGQLEYIVGSGAGDAPALAFFKQTRALLRRFSVYDGAYTGGLELTVGDYDGDNQDDVIVAPRRGGLPVRVWNRRSKRLAEWEFEGKEVRVLPVY